jgi:hypothetical protein
MSELTQRLQERWMVCPYGDQEAQNRLSLDAIIGLERDLAAAQAEIIELREMMQRNADRACELCDERDAAQARVGELEAQAKAVRVEHDEEILHLSNMLYKQSPAGEKAAKCPFDECSDPGEGCYDTLECNSRFVAEIERLRAEASALREACIEDAGSGVTKCLLCLNFIEFPNSSVKTGHAPWCVLAAAPQEPAPETVPYDGNPQSIDGMTERLDEAAAAAPTADQDEIYKAVWETRKTSPMYGEFEPAPPSDARGGDADG